MKKITIKIPDKETKIFSFCWAQAKFDALIDIDTKFNLGAFFRKRKGGKE